MLSCHQVGMCFPSVVALHSSHISSSQSSGLCPLSSYKQEAHVLHCSARPALSCGGLQKRCYKGSVTCLFGGGKGEPEKNKDDSLWQSFDKAMKNLNKELTVEGMLREQMQKLEVEGSGGGSGDFISGGDDGSGDSEDGGSESILEEFIQVLLAIIGIVLVYVYTLRGEELIRLARDYIRYRFGAKASVRLKQAQETWPKYFEPLVGEDDVVENDEIERTMEYLLATTPTWWHHPRKFPLRSLKKVARKTRKRARRPVPA